MTNSVTSPWGETINIPLRFPSNINTQNCHVLALGAWLKNTLCLANSNIAHLSPIIGDLNSAEACRHHENWAKTLIESCDSPLIAIAHDLHPDFHSTRHANALAKILGVPCIPVQHHHAHLMAVLAEHSQDLNFEPSPSSTILGLALDGVGYGNDQTLWGGELLWAQGKDYHRQGHLFPLALPGGDRAAREPWRMVAAALHALGRTQDISTTLQRLYPTSYTHQRSAIATLLTQNINAPLTTSMGRWFDAATGILGLCDVMRYDAEAPIILQKQALQHGAVSPWREGFVIHPPTANSPQRVLDFRPLLSALLSLDIPKQAGYGAALFHATVAAGLAQWLAQEYSMINRQSSPLSALVFGGGVFANDLLTSALCSELTLLLPTSAPPMLQARQIAPGDSAIALGQAWIALCHTSY